jgi:hypothetical protein
VVGEASPPSLHRKTSVGELLYLQIRTILDDHDDDRAQAGRRGHVRKQERQVHLLHRLCFRRSP